MHLTRVRLNDFRNLATIEFTPQPGVNLIGGPNGSGKTSIIEAIFYACTARSFRTASDDLLIRKGSEVARIEVEGLVNGAERTIEIAWGTAHRRQIKIDGVKVPRVAELFEYFHAVSYVPEDVELIYGGPAVRRRLLDLYLSQGDRGYLNDLLEYNRILTQRNALLKGFEISDEEPADLEMLDVWDAQLAAAGSRINAKRLALLAAATTKLAEYHRAIAGSAGDLSWTYETSISGDCTSAEAFRQKLASGRKRDLYLGSTGHGPHRDDVAIKLAAEATRGYASQGEAKSMALAIKFAIYDFLTGQLGDAPILLLDEVTSDLDPQRLAALMATLPKLGQVFLTTAKADQLRSVTAIANEVQLFEGRLL